MKNESWVVCSGAESISEHSKFYTELKVELVDCLGHVGHQSGDFSELFGGVLHRINGSISLSQAARLIGGLQAFGPHPRDPVLNVFAQLSAATRDHPLGPEREFWAHPLLASRDAERRKIEAQYRAGSLSAYQETLAKY